MIRIRSIVKHPLLSGLAVLGLTMAATASHAAIIEMDIFRTVLNLQTDATTVTPYSYYFNMNGIVGSGSDFDSGSLTFPGPASPVAPPDLVAPAAADSPAVWSYGSAGFGTQAELDAAAPFGDYTLNLTNSGTSASDSATIHYTQDAYPESTAQFTASTYNGFQGIDASQNFLASFNPFVSGMIASESLIFMPIFDLTTGDVIDGGSFINSGQTSILIASNTLTAGHNYALDLVFSNRIDGQTDSGIGTFLGFDSRTEIFFTAAPADITPVVPEPASLSLISLGLASAGWLRRRKSAKGDQTIR